MTTSRKKNTTSSATKGTLPRTIKLQERREAKGDTDKVIVVCGAGGFICGHLVQKLVNDGYTVRAVDKKPQNFWYQRSGKTQNLTLNLEM